MAKKTIVVPKVYLETSFVSYLTGESGFVCPQIMAPQTYIENIFMEGKQ